LDNLLAELNTSINAMLALRVDDEELTKRILLRGKDSGRSDDSDPAIIRKRIDEYNNKTAPLIDYYSAQQKFYAVDGIGSVDEIFDRLCGEIEKL